MLPPQTKLQRVLRLVKMVSKIDKQDVSPLINDMSSKQVDMLCELFYNIIQNPKSENLGKKERTKLKKYFRKNRKLCQEIANDKNSAKFRKKCLVEQSGDGVFTTILALAIPLITGLLTK